MQCPVTVAFGYQPIDKEDGDPSTETLTSGETPKNGLLGYSYGFSVVYIESVREKSFGILESTIPAAFNAAKQQATKDFYDILYGVIAHEIGHNPGSQSGDKDHDEGGLMQDGGAKINVPFSPETIRRFRNAIQWTR